MLMINDASAACLEKADAGRDPATPPAARHDRPALTMAPCKVLQGLTTPGRSC
jgi:hypothetical protein